MSLRQSPSRTLVAVAVLLVALGGVSSGPASGEAPAAQPDAPTGLLVDLLPEPLAVEDLAEPRLSWVVNDSRRDARQSAYQVLVATHLGLLAEGQADVWDSGKVEHGSSMSVPYEGPLLQPRTRYHWTVRTWDAAGDPGPWAEPAQFGTAVKDQWKAIPIWAAEPSGPGTAGLPAALGNVASGANPFGCGEAGEDVIRSGRGLVPVEDYPGSGDTWALLRTDFTVGDQPLSHAILYATGVAPEPAAQYVYRAEINGEFVGVGPTRGYDGMVTYNAFDVTDALRPGENALGFVAYAAQGKGVQAQLEVVYQDGTREVVATDESWDARPGGDLYLTVGNAGHASYYNAPREYVRADHWPFGFSQPGFDGVDWGSAVSRPALSGLTGLPTRNLEREIRTPVTVEAIGAGAYRLDFGRTVVGGLRLDVDGEAGCHVDVRLGEELNTDGSVRFQMRTGNHYQDRWTLADGPQTLEHWGYRVFRYAELHNLPASVGPDDIVGVGFVYPFDDDAAAFTASDERLDRVWEFAHDSIRILNVDLYMDTPSRERRAYEADAYLQQLAHYALDREYALARYSTEYLYFHYTWPTEWKLTSATAGWRDYLHSGDSRSLERYYDLLTTKSVRHFMDERGLVVKDPGGAHDPNAWTDIVDWPAAMRDGYVFTDVNTVVNAYNERSLRDLGRIAGAIGRDADAAMFTTLADTSAEAINTYLYDFEAGRYRDGLDVDHHALHASIYPLAFGIPTRDLADPAAAYLAERRIVGNIFSAAYQVEALFEHGRAEDAIDLLTTDDIKGWHNMINIGAGTTMETWDPSFKSNTTFSHPAGASPAYLIPQGLFGVRPLEPGFSRFQVKPNPGGVEAAAITVPSMAGPIEVAFDQDAGALALTLTVPANTVAELWLPAPASVTEGGVPATEATGVRFQRATDGHVLFEVGSGSYRFLVAD